MLIWVYCTSQCTDFGADFVLNPFSPTHSPHSSESMPNPQTTTFRQLSELIEQQTMSGQFWANFETILARFPADFWIKYGQILGQFCGQIWADFGTNYGQAFGSILRMILGTSLCWFKANLKTDFGSILRPILGRF
jgi:hypothetical protein